MPPDTVFNETELSSEDEDSDFAPTAVPADEDGDSDSEADEGAARPGRAKQRKGGDEAEDIGLENSGDEAIVSRGRKKQRRRKKGTEDDDEGGEGGLIKTRRMRAEEKAERKPLLSTEGATVDVDALWASMTAKSIRHRSATPDGNKENSHEGNQNTQTSDVMDVDAAAARPIAAEVDGSDTITIKRTYNFAGKVHVEEKVVLRDSAEAKLWLAEQAANGNTNVEGAGDGAKPRRPLKKLRRSAFEPIPTEPLPVRSDLDFAVAAVTARAAALQTAAQAHKLNTVEKSRMDWAGFVDKEGIKDELETAGKAKGSFMNQQAFLARVEQKKEEEARQARIAKMNR